VFGYTSRQITIGAREHRDAGKLTREHQWFVPGPVQIRADAFRIPDDDYAIPAIPASIAAAENGWTLAHFDEHPRDARRHWRLPAAADGKIANADHRVPQAAAKIGTARVPLTSPARHRGVESAQQWAIRMTSGTARPHLHRPTA
jgi:hypothetical protein